MSDMEDLLNLESVEVDAMAAAALRDSAVVGQAALDEAELVLMKPATSVAVVPLGSMPEQGAWEQMCQMAVTFAESGLVPSALRRKPADVLLVLMTALDLKIGPTTALQLCYVIEGKVTIAPKLRLALLNNSGRGTIRPAIGNTAESCTAEVFDSDRSTKIGEFTLTVDDVPKELFRKNNWKNYPKRMLWWRCAGFALDDFFPEAGLGVFSPDELGATTNEDGEPIDVHNVEAPRGFNRSAASKAEAPGIEAYTLEIVNQLRQALSDCDDDILKGDARDGWTKAFGKQAAASFSQAQGMKAAALLRPFVGRIAVEGVIVEEETFVDTEPF